MWILHFAISHLRYQVTGLRATQIILSKKKKCLEVNTFFLTLLYWNPMLGGTRWVCNISKVRVQYSSSILLTLKNSSYCLISFRAWFATPITKEHIFLWITLLKASICIFFPYLGIVLLSGASLFPHPYNNEILQYSQFHASLHCCD